MGFNINVMNSNESSVSKDVLFEEVIKIPKPFNILDHSSEKPEIIQAHLIEENWKHSKKLKMQKIEKNKTRSKEITLRLKPAEPAKEVKKNSQIPVKDVNNLPFPICNGNEKESEVDWVIYEICTVYVDEDCPLICFHVAVFDS